MKELIEWVGAIVVAIIIESTPVFWTLSVANKWNPFVKWILTIAFAAQLITLILRIKDGET